MQTSHDAEMADLPNGHPPGATRFWNPPLGSEQKMYCSGASSGIPCEGGDPDHLVFGRRLEAGGGSSMGSGEKGLGYKASGSTPEGASPLPTDSILRTGEKDLGAMVVQISGTVFPENTQRVAGSLFEYKYCNIPRQLDYVAYMIHMAVFGIFGVIVRYLLQRLFGASVRALLNNGTPPYISLPPNMIGSFFMGWFGLVFKGDMSHFSDHLATGLATGFLGSLSTFCGWNQRMLELSSNGNWVYAMAGIVLGLFLVNESYRLGVESAVCLRRFIFGTCEQGQEGVALTRGRQMLMYNPKWLAAVVMTTVMLLIWGLLLGVSGAFARTQLDRVADGALLWLSCLVAPPGVWLRWYLVSLNGQGLGKQGSLKWLPLGTLTANVSAACTMAALATLKKAVNTRKCAIVVTGVQYGFLGSLSTIPTFVAEVYTMRQSGHLGRALAYTAATLIPSFGLGTLIYSLPMWTKHYH